VSYGGSSFFAQDRALRRTAVSGGTQVVRSNRHRPELNRTPSISERAVVPPSTAAEGQARPGAAKTGQNRPKPARPPLECELARTGGSTPLSYTRRASNPNSGRCESGRAGVYPYSLPVWGLLPGRGGRPGRTDQGGQNRPAHLPTGGRQTSHGAALKRKSSLRTPVWAEIPPIGNPRSVSIRRIRVIRGRSTQPGGQNRPKPVTRPARRALSAWRSALCALRAPADVRTKPQPPALGSAV
jgi:hypothetical protein